MDIGDVDVTSVIPGTGATNLGKAIDTTTGATDTGVLSLATRDDALSALTPVEGDNIQLRVDANGALWTIHSGTLAVTQSGTWDEVGINDSGNSITVDNAALSVVGGGVEATALRVTVASDSTGVLSVDDNGAALTVDNGGTFAVQIDAGAVTSLALLDDVVFADDAAFTLATSKTAVVGAIRDDSLAALTAIEGDVVPLRVSSTGALHVTGGGGGTEFAEDSAHSSGALGNLPFAVRNDAGISLVGTDGDYAPLSVNSAGALYVTGGGGGTEYTVDAAAPAAPVGATFTMERDDALSALTEIEGDWTNPRASANGALWVSVDGTVTVGSHAVTNAGTFAVQIDAGAVTSLALIDDVVFAEDVAAQAADKGVAVLAVRRDADTSLVGTDNDYAQLQVDANGYLKVEIFDGGGSHTVDGTVTANLAAGTNNIGDVDVLTVVTGTGATNLGKAEDAAHTTGDTGVYMLAVRDDALAAHSGTDGDYESLHTNAIGALYTQVAPNTAGGLTIFQSIDLDESEEEVKATAGQLYSIAAFNHTAAPLYLKFYNLTAANTTVGTSTPVATFTIPGNADSDGAGLIWNNTLGLAFSTAISAAVTTGIAVADTGAPAANAASVVLGYA